MTGYDLDGDVADSAVDLVMWAVSELRVKALGSVLVSVHRAAFSGAACGSMA